MRIRPFFLRAGGAVDLYEDDGKTKGHTESGG